MRQPPPSVCLALGAIGATAVLATDLGKVAYGWPSLPPPLHELVVTMVGVAMTAGLLGSWLIDIFRLARRVGQAPGDGR